MVSCFHPVTPELLEDLKKVVGEKYVRYDEDTLDQYQTDEEGNPHFFKKPEVVVFPGSTEEVGNYGEHGYQTNDIQPYHMFSCGVHSNRLIHNLIFDCDSCSGRILIL